jgi:DNA polymerase-1
MSDALVVFDGHALMHRAFHAGQRQLAADGREVGAVLTLCDHLVRFLSKMRARHLVMAFDPGGPLFRHDIAADYKSTRKPTDPELLPQFDWVKEAVQALGVRTVCVDGFEADDCIATVVHQARAEGLPAWIIGLDKDLFQLVTDDDPPVRMFVPSTKRVVDEAAVAERLGVPPAAALDYYALVGDSGDHIAGIKGVGPKAATALLQAFGSLEGIFDHLDDIHRLDLRGAGRLPLRLLAGRDAAHLARRLLALRTDVPLGLGSLRTTLRWMGPSAEADAVFAALGDDRALRVARSVAASTR